MKTFKTIAEAIEYAKANSLYSDDLISKLEKNFICKQNAGCKDETIFVIDPYGLLD